MQQSIDSLETQSQSNQSTLNAISSDMAVIDQNIDRQKDDIRHLKDAPHRIASSTKEGENRLSEIDGKNDALQTQITLTNLQTRKFETDGIDAKKAVDDSEAAILGKKKTLADFIIRIHRLKNLLKLKTEEGNKLNPLGTLLHAIDRQINSKQRLVAVKNIGDSIKEIHTYHLEWVSEFVKLVTDSVPHLDAVTDHASFLDHYRRVLAFRDKIPSDKLIVSESDQLSRKIDQIESSTRELQKSMREFAQSPGLVVYNYRAEKHKDMQQNIGSSLLSFDRDMALYVGTLHHARAVIQKFQEKRAYLKQAVVQQWIELLRVRLHAVNAKTGAKLVKNIYRMLSSDQIVAELKVRVERQKERSTALLYDRTAPFHARKQCATCIKLINRISHLIRAGEIPLSKAFKDESKRYLAQSNDACALTLKQANIAIRDPAYQRERMRITKIVNRRARNRFSTTCKKTADRILNGTTGSLNEALFLEFRKSC